ncbi:MAG: hypothetical protein ABS45_00370 [Comamonas sp. SCN 65-56]|uniref:hypothetical protein n=1 Tax=Comamonas sp. SCN 65-56 TaxID=1660095 RepID=UPI00086D68FA|nr:hypothetical protein [Comamonas sp. SCN 65-56]ODS93856.1 MAG: hypothetical protein ABS45_00370 [Comamonas sp. SCN 65-56]
MPIANVIQRGPVIYVYNEKNQTLFTKIVGREPTDGVKGYTSSFVNIQMGRVIYTYNEKGATTGTKIV